MVSGRGRSWASGALPLTASCRRASLAAGAIVPQEQAAELVGAPDDERERGHDDELRRDDGQRQRDCPAGQREEPARGDRGPTSRACGTFGPDPVSARLV